jgi:hypothetical protein
MGKGRHNLQREATSAKWNGHKNESRNARAGFARSLIGDLTGWMASRLSGEPRPRPQLAVLERITLAPRQSLTLIEAGGQRLLVATSADGTPAFYPLVGVAGRSALLDKGLGNFSRGQTSW